MLRNKEFRQLTMLLTVLSIIMIAIGWGINTASGILVATACAVFGTAFFLFTKTRYRGLARLSEQIDLVLHHEDQLLIGELEEGELSILHSEITKMLIRIREQNGALHKEKERLADSLADIAHQLRTPLTSVNLILSLVASQPDEQERKTLNREAEALLLRMDGLITALLKLSRLDAGIVLFQNEHIDVNHLVKTALQPFVFLMEVRNVEVQVHIPAGVTIQGDTVWLAEALQNVIKNGLDSVGDHGQIEIEATDNPLYTELTIHDSGAGFVVEEIPHIFDRFYSGSSSSATGSGIGLSLSRMIITRQGGIITAANHPQGGAFFRIRFPK